MSRKNQNKRWFRMNVAIVGCLAVALVAPAFGQVFTEPPDFPNFMPGPSAAHPGGGCFWLARGDIAPAGDHDWLQCVIPFNATDVWVDVDADDYQDTTLDVWINGVFFGSNDDDFDLSPDEICGYATNPLDSLVEVGDLLAGDVIDIDVGGFADSQEVFGYDLYVHAIPEPASLALLGLGLVLLRRR